MVCVVWVVCLVFVVCVGVSVEGCMLFFMVVFRNFFLGLCFDILMWLSCCSCWILVFCVLVWRSCFCWCVVWLFGFSVDDWCLGLCLNKSCICLLYMCFSLFLVVCWWSGFLWVILCFWICIFMVWWFVLVYCFGLVVFVCRCLLLVVLVDLLFCLCVVFLNMVSWVWVLIGLVFVMDWLVWWIVCILCC